MHHIVSEDNVGVHIGMFFQICFLKIVLFYHNIRHSNPFRQEKIGIFRHFHKEGFLYGLTLSNINPHQFRQPL